MSYAGHDGLDNLIVIYDSNDVTLDKMADFTQSEVFIENLKYYTFMIILR
jgi:transketolase